MIKYYITTLRLHAVLNTNRPTHHLQSSPLQFSDVTQCIDVMYQSLHAYKIVQLSPVHGDCESEEQVLAQTILYMIDLLKYTKNH